MRPVARLAAIALPVLLGAAAPELARPAPALPGSVPPPQGATLDGGFYGTVHVTPPAGDMDGFVVLFSRGEAWAAPDQAAAEALAAHGAYVVGVATGAYVARLASAGEACHHLQGDAEAMSHQIERARGTAAYVTPVVAGAGQGGRLAEQVLAEAPVNTIAGAISIDPAAPDPRVRPCPAETPGPALPGFWEVGTTPAMPADAAAALAALREGGVTFGLHRLAAGETEAAALPALLAPHLGQRRFNPESVSDLPLVELPAARPSGRLAVVISGDGGWRDIDKTIAEDLRQGGVSVVGWDSLRYFWSGRTPEQTAADLARVLRAYEARWDAHDVALVGYSFGADVIPFAYNRLPPGLRGGIHRISLLGFAPAADFEIRVGGWLGLPPSNAALPVKDEIARVPPALVQCFYGAAEDDTACPSLQGTGVQIVRTDGEHHFDGNYHRLSQTILQGWAKRDG